MIKLFDLLNGTRLRKKNVYFQYSTEEQFTGEYWIDGKKIYTRTFSETYNAVWAYNKNLMSGINEIINSYGVTQGSGGTKCLFPSKNGFITLTTAGIVRIELDSGYESKYFCVTVLYTKK